MQQYILGIDIGTGSTKCVAANLQGAVIGTAQQHYPVYHPRQGFSEQDPELIWHAFRACVKDIVSTLGYAPQAISLSSAMHSVIPVSENGTALAAMMTWADVRSESIAREIKDSTAGEGLYKATGTPIHPMSPLCKIIWLRKNSKSLFANAYKFISIKEYIWFKLFHEFQIDYSIASATGLFDILKLSWHNDACALAGITTEKLSDPVNTNYYRSDVARQAAIELGLPAEVIWMIGASDGCCANLGSHVSASGTAALTIGTSGAVRVTNPFPIYNYGAMTFNYLLDEKTFVSGGAVNNGGNAADWLLQKFLHQPGFTLANYQEMFDAIESIAAGSNGLLFLPYLNGERAPIWDANSSGAFLNIRPEHSRDHFLRAALEGICYALNDVLTSLENTSAAINQVNISGGFINAVTWVQLLADITGKKLAVLQLDDASAMGAIYLAMHTLYPQIDYLHAGAESLFINPDPEKHKIYSDNFIIYKKLYPNLKETMLLLQHLR